MKQLRGVEEALPYEADRLWREWQAGGDLRTRKGKITVGWSPERKQTFLQRSKEDVQDYRYFPEPDLVAFAPSREDVERLRAQIPELPTARRARFMKDYGLSDYDVRILVDDRALADFFEETVRAAGGEAKTVANWVTGEFLRYLKNDGGSVAGAKITPAQLGALVALVNKGDVSGSAAKDVFAEMWQTGTAPEAIVKSKGLTQVSDESAIAAAVDAVLAENPKAIADYKAGNQRALDGLKGPIYKRLGKSANASVVNRILAERISRPS